MSSAVTREAPSAQHESEGHARQAEQTISPTPEILGPTTALPRSAFGDAMGKPVMRHSTSGVLRVTVMRTTQRHLGNRSTQRLVAQLSRSWIVQRTCSCGGTCEKCSQQAALAPMQEEIHVVQAQANGTLTADTITADTVRPAGSSGMPMDAETRRSMEGHFGSDFSDVRIHHGSSAAQAAEAIQADAYTTGRDIYFGEGKYQPESAEGSKLLAHELTHVEQQAAGEAPSQALPSRNGDVVIGAPNDRLEEEAEQHAEAFNHEQHSGSVTPDSSGKVRRQGWNSLTDNPISNTIASGAKKVGEYIGEKIEKYAPGAIKFFRGIRDFFKEKLSAGADALFGGILSSIREKGIAATLESMIGSFAAGALYAVGGFLAGHCAAMGQLAEHLVDVIAKFGGQAIDSVKKDFDSFKGKFDEMWSEYGAPALDWVKKKLKAIWKEVEDTASKIWNWLKPLRESIGTIWNEVTDFLIESRRSYNEWLEWIVPKAIDEWEKVKAKIKPYMETVKTVAKVLGVIVLILSPAGPFILIGAAVYGLYQGVKAIWEKWGKGFTAGVRQWFANEALPSVQNKLKDFKAKVDSVKEKIQAGLQQVYDGFMKVLDALGVLSFLESVKSAIAAISAKIQGFKEKVQQKLEEWSKKLQELLAKADPYLQQIKEFFRQTLLVALFGPMAFLDDGVWNTINKIVNLAMKTPCLKELGGLMRVPSIIAWLGRVRAGIKQGIETIKNPGPLLEQLKNAIAPMIAKIEPEIRARVTAMSAAYTDREIFIQVSIMHYLSKSLSELGGNWWPQLKKIGHDLLWPWDEVGKEFMPMLDAFGAAISAIFELEFSAAIDHFLEGMRKFNGIAGTLAGWFTIASVLIGAALGALGFAFGPAGVATVGAGATAGFEFAETVGMTLLVIALVTEASVIEKAEFDLRYQNSRLPTEKERNDADQKDCQDIAGSLVSLITMGALMLLGSIAAKFAKFLWSLVKEVPIISDIAEALASAKKKVGEFSLKPKAEGVPVEGGVGEGGVPRDTGTPDPDTTAKPSDFTPEQMDAANKKLAERVNNSKNVREVTDPALKEKYDLEVDLEDGHTYRRKKDGTWCLFSDPKCGVVQPESVNVAADAQKAKLDANKPVANVEGQPETQPEAEPETPGQQADTPPRRPTAPKEWPPKPPEGRKPGVNDPNGAEWRYQRYVYDSFKAGKGPSLGTGPKDILPPDLYVDRYFEPTASGGRPGRRGGEQQLKAKKILEGEGIQPTENVELGGRYPDGIDPKPNLAGGRNYYEVGEMLKKGMPESRERIKLADEVAALKPNDTVTFVDKNDTSKRITYRPGDNVEAKTLSPAKSVGAGE